MTIKEIAEITGAGIRTIKRGDEMMYYTPKKVLKYIKKMLKTLDFNKKK